MIVFYENAVKRLIHHGISEPRGGLLLQGTKRVLDGLMVIRRIDPIIALCSGVVEIQQFEQRCHAGIHIP